MFIDNKYTKTYFQIIQKAKSENRSKEYSYFEYHHIIPKSLGGSNELFNLVLLTFKEHYICHRLLCKMTNNKADTTKMKYALFKLGSINQHQSRNLSKLQILKCLEANRNASKTRNHKPMLGKSHSEETKQKIREKRKHQIITQETRQKISEANKLTNESRAAKVSQSLKGRIKTPEHRAKLSIATTNSWAKRKEMVGNDGNDPSSFVCKTNILPLN